MAPGIVTVITVNYLLLLQIGTNGYFTLDQQFDDYQSAVFNEHTNMSLIAPFFTDIDISYNGAGNIFYEAHTPDTSQILLSSIDAVINQSMETEFHGEWLLVAEWNNVQEYGSPNTVSNWLCILTTKYKIFKVAQGLMNHIPLSRRLTRSREF